jgi:hypothetical protein
MVKEDIAYAVKRTTTHNMFNVKRSVNGTIQIALDLNQPFSITIKSNLHVQIALKPRKISLKKKPNTNIAD